MHTTRNKREDQMISQKQIKPEVKTGLNSIPFYSPTLLGLCTKSSLCFLQMCVGGAVADLDDHQWLLLVPLQKGVVSAPYPPLHPSPPYTLSLISPSPFPLTKGRLRSPCTSLSLVTPPSLLSSGQTNDDEELGHSGPQEVKDVHLQEVLRSPSGQVSDLWSTLVDEGPVLDDHLHRLLLSSSPPPPHGWISQWTTMKTVFMSVSACLSPLHSGIVTPYLHCASSS